MPEHKKKTITCGACDGFGEHSEGQCDICGGTGRVPFQSEYKEKEMSL